MEPFQFRRREMVSIGSAHIERTFKDALPLTDAVWPSEDEIFCLRRGPDGVELLLVAEDKPLVVYQASRVLQLMAQGHAGLFLNTGQQLIRWTHVGCDAGYEHPAGIVSVAICESGAVACVVGERPGHWRAVVVDPRRSSSQVLEAERVLHLLWVGDTLVLVCAERRQGIDGVVFRLWKEGEGLRTLFRTGLTIRAEATAHKGKIAVAGGLHDDAPSQPETVVQRVQHLLGRVGRRHERCIGRIGEALARTEDMAMGVAGAGGQRQ